MFKPLAFLAAVCFSFALPNAVSAAADRPNFVFFIADDVSPDDLSIYGNKVIQTPNLQKLSEQALVFDNAYQVISSCSPSRCSIITGRYPHNHGAPELHTELPKGQTTFVQKLKDAGYYTVISGKNHMAKPEQLGFMVNSDSKPSGAEKWVKHLQDRPKDKPFFCWFASHDAHYKFELNDLAPRYKPEDVPVPPMLYDGPLTRGEIVGSYHEISRTDYYVGKLMNELKKQGVADNTYFVYCADNGRPFPRCKTYLYDSGIRTPLVIAGPGIKAGRSSSLISAVDYGATFLELAGLAKPPTMQGVSFTAILRDPKATVREVAFAERNWHVFQNHARAVRTGDWLYVWNAWPDKPNVAGESSQFSFAAAKELWDAAEAGKLTPEQALLTKTPQPPEMLFNVKDDPNQFTNLAGMTEHQQTLEKMRSLLDRWKQETGDSVPAKPTPDRQPIHDDKPFPNFKRGDYPGAAKNATTINAPGPVKMVDEN